MESSEREGFVRPERWGMAVFVGLLLVHLWGIGTGWTSRSLPGNEFRQAQTAISALFIQRDHNYTLAYPTPVLGAPWSIPFEFPLYQWTVVGISNATGLPLVQAGRLVSVLCFYLSLPALWLLLGKVGVSRLGRWLVLGLTLSCPLYIFYTRAVLIETMALMFSLWFLYGFVVGVAERKGAWLIVANVAGALAGAVKVTTFILYLLPAVAWVIFFLWQAWRSPRASRGQEYAGLVGRIGAAVAVPFAVTYAWLRYADAVKARNPLAEVFVSGNLELFNFGTWADRTEWEHWSGRLAWIQSELVGVIGGALLLVLFVVFARRQWKLVVGSLLLFFAIQLVFPVLYKIHAYYFVANGFFLLAAAGVILAAVMESKVPRWAAWTILAGLHLLQLSGFVRGHYQEQRIWSPGGTGLTAALNAITEPEDVLVVIGEDWSSVTPFFAERRALLLRTGWENETERVKQSLAKLQGRRVSAIVMREPANSDERLRGGVMNFFERHFDPVFTWRDATVYVPRELRASALELLAARRLEGVIPDATAPVDKNVTNLREVEVAQLSPIERRAFGEMSPAPVRVFATFGVGAEGEPGALFYNAHPDSRLWFKPSAGHRHVSARYRIVDAAWKDVPAAEATDGVVFRIAEIRAGGGQRVVFERLLNPRSRMEDRGVQIVNLDIDLAEGSELLFETTPGPARQYSRDWAGWGKIEIL